MRTSVKRRRMSVLAAAVALCLAVGMLVALPASAHDVSAINVDCDAVTVRFKNFPSQPTPVTFTIQVGSAPVITRVVNISDAQNVSIDISSATSGLNGQTATVNVDVTWFLHGANNHEHETTSVTCGTYPTSTSSSTSTSTSSSTSTSTSTSSTTTTTKPPRTTTTTKPPRTTTTRPATTTTTPPHLPGDIFQVELRRCTQVHEGYRNFPAGTSVRWKVIQDGKTVAIGRFIAEGGRNYHFLTQPIGARLKASPHVADVHYYWRINGVLKKYFVRRAPGCSGTSVTDGKSGLGNLFAVDLRHCRRLHIGYQFFPKRTSVVWTVTQGNKGRYGVVHAEKGNQYHFTNVPLRMTLSGKSKAKVSFYWSIDGRLYHYRITRSPGC